MASDHVIRANAAMTELHYFERGSEPRDLAGLTIANDLCFVVQRANRIISRGSDTALRSTGLTTEQTLLLSAIAQAGSVRAAELSRDLVVDATTITANLKPLIREGWICTSVDVNDGRARRISLTKAGIERLEMAIKHLQQYERALTERIGGETNRHAVCDTLDKVAIAGRL